MTEARRQIVWITGASSGIGEAVAVTLARAGNIVAASARSKDKLAGLAAQSYGEGKIVAYPGDVTDKASLQDTAQAIAADLGGIDTAILSAGTYHPDEPGTFDAAAIADQFTLNVMGTVNTLDVLLPIMRRQGHGHIAIIASVAGYRGLPMAAGYGATKAALINMAEALKLDLQRQGIKLQVICPGFVKTPLTDKNNFPMPFLISAEKAAEFIKKGLDSRRFEIVFPWQMALSMKLLRFLPYRLYFPLIARITGAVKKA